MVSMTTSEFTDQATDTTEYVAFVRRILAALERRVAHADIDALAQLDGLRTDLEVHITRAVDKLRHDDVPASWADIGWALGMDRANARRKYGHVGGARRPGGQPGNLR